MICYETLIGKAHDMITFLSRAHNIIGFIVKLQPFNGRFHNDGVRLSDVY